jgi:hypothetical protein
MYQSCKKPVPNYLRLEREETSFILHLFTTSPVSDANTKKNQYSNIHAFSQNMLETECMSYNFHHHDFLLSVEQLAEHKSEERHSTYCVT